VLGAKSTRYKDIETLLAKPAYQSRNSKLVVQLSGKRKEVVREDASDNAKQEGTQSAMQFE